MRGYSVTRSYEIQNVLVVSVEFSSWNDFAAVLVGDNDEHLRAEWIDSRSAKCDRRETYSKLKEIYLQITVQQRQVSTFGYLYLSQNSIRQQLACNWINVLPNTIKVLESLPIYIQRSKRNKYGRNGWWETTGKKRWKENIADSKLREQCCNENLQHRVQQNSFERILGINFLEAVICAILLRADSNNIHVASNIPLGS